jgi:hypothetical protein
MFLNKAFVRKRLAVGWILIAQILAAPVHRNTSWLSQGLIAATVETGSLECILALQ